MAMIDDRVKHVGISKIRLLNCERLTEFSRSDNLIVFRDGGEPLAVLVPYHQYLDRLEALRIFRLLIEEHAVSPASAQK